MKLKKSMIFVLAFSMLFCSSHAIATEVNSFDHREGGIQTNVVETVPFFDDVGKPRSMNERFLNDLLKINHSAPLLNAENLPIIRLGRELISVAYVTELFFVKRAIAKPEVIEITVSAAGDVTLGSDDSYGYEGSFIQAAKRNDFSFFVENIKELFSNDDLTIVNLEGPLTKATNKAQKQFAFKGDPSYTEILTLGSIEVVNLANNHTFDFLQKGYDDTMRHLEKAGVGFFGNEQQLMTEIKGVKIGLLGYTGWYDSVTLRNRISKDVQLLKEQGAVIVIVSFHWGEERSYVPNQTQKLIGRYTIEKGADLVLGHHPHVVQGIEEYNGKFIVYSLGNFMFGGNRNPSDKDTFVFQQTFLVEDGELSEKTEIEILPFSISSVSHRNNFQPTPLTGSAATVLKDKIVELSKKIR